MAANEDIFPATRLTPLAVRWKQLNAAKRHREAMEVLELIIIGSTAMFERLAQHENFHHTVSLDILVAAAQEKVVAWLLRWQPRKGRLFSYFSKCVSGDTLVGLPNGKSLTIAEIVDKRLEIDVQSCDENARKFTSARVVDWHCNPASIDDWHKLTVSINGQLISKATVYLTKEHPVMTQRGWVTAEELVSGTDQVFSFLGFCDVACGPCTDADFKCFDTSKKYDIEVEGTHNFAANGVVVHNCARHAFLAEVLKMSQFRKRIHVTSNNLEQFYGTEDHEVDKHDLAREVRERIDEMTCRWGDPQEIGAIRYLIECIVDDQHDRHGAVRAAMYAYALGHEHTKFFYTWALTALRQRMYDKIYVGFTDQDLMRASESYSLFIDLADIIGIDKSKEAVAVLGGTRIKIPTLSYLTKLRQNYSLHREIGQTDLSPDAIAGVAKKHKKTAKSATEIFEQMSHTLNANRFGEHEIYGQHE